jgi:hypothetical protein
LETSHTCPNRGTIRASVSNAPGTAGVASIRAVSPLKNWVSLLPGTTPPPMMTRPISTPSRMSCMFMPISLLSVKLEQKY